MVFTFQNTSEGKVIVDQERLPSGMTVRIEFQLYDLENIGLANVFLNVFHKRKQISDNTLKSTGKDGVYPFVWAIRKLREFEEYAKEELCHSLPTYIQVDWEDNRRGRIYKRFLQREGYLLKNFGEGRKLYKQLDIEIE